MMTSLEFDFEVDACGLMCPLPLLRLKKALQALEQGKVVRVLATDPAAVLDFGVFVEQAAMPCCTGKRKRGCCVF